ncbi:MAG: glycosyltransferase [Nitrososphaerota archaeon]
MKIIRSLLGDYYNVFRKETPFIDRSSVVTLTINCDSNLNDGLKILVTEENIGLRNQKVSLITTCLNEEKHLHSWFNSIMQQTRKPDELVIVDGGSTDRTIELLYELADKAPFPVKIIQSNGANIARGRNIAIRNSSYQLIVCSDIGTILDKDWLLYMVVPFEIDPEIKVSFGITLTLENQSPYSKYFVLPVENIIPQTFLPSSRTMGFFKSVWEEVGGYPEWLTDAGEDTLFDIFIKRLPIKCAYVPQAVVWWYGPDSFIQALKTAYRYAFGDGEAAVFTSNYMAKVRRNFLILSYLGLLAGLYILVLIVFGSEIIFLIIALLMLMLIIRKTRGLKQLVKCNERLITFAISLCQSIAFVRGVLHRPLTELRWAKLLEDDLSRIIEKYRDRKDVVIYLPTHDWGYMFQRPQQIARAFAKQGYLWFYCTNNEKVDNVRSFVEVEDGLIICNVPLQVFSKVNNPIVYLGSSSLVSKLRYFNNPYIVYDHYDELSVSSSCEKDHLDLLRKANLVIVSSRRLLEKVHRVRSDVILVPNGVDYKFIASIRIENFEIPNDLKPVVELKKPIIGYSGALANWFDYELMVTVAKSCRHWEFVFIGDDYDHSLHSSNILSLPNVHWLGMKSYDQLFRYVYCFDVGIIPFKINEITMSASPIKLFEYAACGKPIVSTPIPECINYPEVLVASGDIEFIQSIEYALTLASDVNYQRKLENIARNNSWEVRTSKIIEKIKK